jgi:hypothetical protein
VGWSLLTVDTEVNGDSNSTNENEMGPSLVGSLGLSCRYNIFLSCLGGFSRPSTINFFLHRTLYILIHLSPAQQAGQAVVLGRLSLNMGL